MTLEVAGKFHLARWGRLLWLTRHDDRPHPQWAPNKELNLAFIHQQGPLVRQGRIK